MCGDKMNIFKFKKSKISIFNKPKRCRTNLKQATLLKRTKGKGIFKRFADSDKDGVINGLDCFPFNKKKHNQYKYKSTTFENKENIERTNKFFRENPIKQYVKVTKNYRDKEIQAQKAPWTKKDD